MNREWLFPMGDPSSQRDIWAAAFGAAWAAQSALFKEGELECLPTWNHTKYYCEKVADDAVKAFMELTTEKKPDDGTRRR